MSWISSINWARGWRRLIWTLFFAAFYAVVVYMAKDMAGTQPVVFGIILLAAIVCAVAFVYSRTSREALVIALLALCVHAFLEISYWSAVVDDTSTQAMREQAAATSRDVVNEKRRARYASSASGKGAGQLAAEVEVLKQDARWMSSGQCTNATAPASRTFCQDYYRLVADLAAAKEAANLEKVVFHTSVERVDIPRNLAKGALWLSDVTTISVQAATNILVGLMVLFIQAGVALCLRVGWEPEKPQEAAGATFQRPISLAGSFADPAYNSVSVAPGTPMEETRRKMAAMKAADSFALADHSSALTGKTEEQTPFEKIKSGLEEALEIVRKDTGTDPDGPGTPAPASEEPKIEEVAARSEKVISLFRDDGKGPETSRGKKKSHKPEGKVESWLGASTTQVDDPAVKTSSADCWRSYLAYCDTEGKQPMHRKVFSRKLGVLLGRASGKGRKRDAKGSVFTGLMINPVVMTARRRVA
jgi:hypothetical protein